MPQYKYVEVVTETREYDIDLPDDATLTVDTIRAVAYKQQPRIKFAEVEDQSLYDAHGVEVEEWEG